MPWPPLSEKETKMGNSLASLCRRIRQKIIWLNECWIRWLIQGSSCQGRCCPDFPDKETKSRKKSHDKPEWTKRMWTTDNMSVCPVENLCIVQREVGRSTFISLLWFNVLCGHPQILDKQCGLQNSWGHCISLGETDLSDGGVGALPWGGMLPADQGHMPVNYGWRSAGASGLTENCAHGRVGVEVGYSIWDNLKEKWWRGNGFGGGRGGRTVFVPAELAWACDRRGLRRTVVLERSSWDSPRSAAIVDGPPQDLKEGNYEVLSDLRKA